MITICLSKLFFFQIHDNTCTCEIDLNKNKLAIYQISFLVIIKIQYYSREYLQVRIYQILDIILNHGDHLEIYAFNDNYRI